MPIYEYCCHNCQKVYERVFKVTAFPKTIKCQYCGKRAKKILSKGAIQTDNDVPWMESAVKVLQPSWEKPITTRSEHRKYLKEKGIEAIG